MNQKLLDEIEEIKRLVIDTSGESFSDDDNLDRIQQICEQIIIDYKVNERLQQPDN